MLRHSKSTSSTHTKEGRDAPCLLCLLCVDVDLLLAGSVDHLLACGDKHFHAAVLSATFGGLVGSNGVSPAFAFRFEARTAHALTHEVVAHSVGALLREAHIEVVATGVVGVADDCEIGLRILVQVDSDAAQ